jgi:hypothetical protein
VRPVDEIIALLEAWRPSPGEQRETVTALAQDLLNAAAGNPALYSANAPRFAQLPIIYVRNVLQGFENAATNNNDLDWKNALALIAAAVRPATRPPIGIEGDDPDWSCFEIRVPHGNAKDLAEGRSHCCRARTPGRRQNPSDDSDRDRSAAPGDVTRNRTYLRVQTAV